MALKITREEAYAQGTKAAELLLAAGSVQMGVESDFKWARNVFMGVQNLDLREELTKFSKERMASDLDLTRFPECRGLREVVEAQHKGFTDVCSDPFIVAYHFDWYWFVTRRLNPRFIGKHPPLAQCTDFWFADSREGGPIHGSNRDDVLFRYGEDFQQKSTPKSGPREERFTGIT